MIYKVIEIRCLVFGTILFGITSLSPAMPFTFEGQFSAWVLTMDREETTKSENLGTRYIPNASWQADERSNVIVDLEASWNFIATTGYSNEGESDAEFIIDPYRWWLRFSTPRFEARFGLQKINFGPAKILRSLMWFDRLDPKDPLQLTEGVYGLRLRYYFQNNANVWLWGLYGNDDPKGWEMFATKEKTPEVGGRIQYPVGNTELAVTAHHRLLQQDDIAENRLALDGFWDIGVGLWFESAIVQADFAGDSLDWQSFLTLGADYTFPVGSGLNIMSEHLMLAMDDSPFGDKNRSNISSLSISYPLGFMDRLSYFSYYNWDSEMPFHYISWQRTYDRWVIHISGYWTSEIKTAYFASSGSRVLGNQGIQLLVIFNH